MSEVTEILCAIEQGHPQAAEQLLPLVYDELRKLAAGHMANELPGHTLDATGLVHEAYLRLGGAETIGPILLGIGAPVHVLQAGDDIEDIVAMTAVAVMDAQSRG